MSSAVADILRKAAELNRSDDRRGGNLVRIERGQRIIVVGDLHGNRQALAKVLAICQSFSDPNWRLLLQEIIHGPADPQCGCDRSVELLLKAVRFKIEHPRQVVFLMGNHDVAQLTGREITRGGCGVCHGFTDGIQYLFGADGPEVLSAVEEFLASQPLAARCPNDVLITHSLPSAGRMHLGGTEILNRITNRDDLFRSGPVYEWTWGREHTPQQLEQLAVELGVSFFVLGHRNVPTGAELLGPRAIALACDHPKGCLICFDGDKPLGFDNVCDHLRYIAQL